jgi:hypothetical protein
MVQLCMGALLRMCLRLSSDFGVLCLLVLLAESVASGFAPVLDGHVMKVLYGVHQEQHYGKMRLWGAVGWGLFSVVSGSAQEWQLLGLGHDMMFLLNGCMAVLAAGALYRMPRAPRSAEEEVAADAEPEPVGESGAAVPAQMEPLAVVPKTRAPEARAGLSSLLKPHIITFIVTVLCMGMCMGIITNFLFIWLEELGGGADIMGWSLFFTCVSEVPLFHFSGALIKRFGNTVLLIAALVCYGIRLVAYSFLTEPWAVLPIELLHGVTFGIGWACCVAFAAEVAPLDLRSTVQGLLAGVHWGIGNSVGAVVGGFTYAAVGGQRTWWLCEVLVVIGLVAAVCTVRLAPATVALQSTSYSAVQWDEGAISRRESEEEGKLRQDVSLEIPPLHALGSASSSEEDGPDETIV